MNNRFVLILGASVIAFFGFLFFAKKDNTTQTGTTSGQTSNHTYGEGKTGVVLTEYGDFECSGCYRFYPIIEQVKEKYKDKITFQFKHLPLYEITSHENALLASKAAEAASAQGKFWEMYSKLYTNQPSWGEAVNAEPFFETYAKEIGLDVEKFKTDLKSEAINSIVQADRNEAKSKGYNSTPTFEIDGKTVEGARDTVEFFSELIDKAIAEKQKNSQ